MKKEEFLKQLEYLLQDIPDEDKEEAVSYYRDYLEEAGCENEEKAIEEFGSPERVAAIIRADAAGNLKDGGAFTENGYEDERFRDPNYQVVKRLDLPEEKEPESRGSRQREGAYHESSYAGGEYRSGHGKGPFRGSPFRERYTKSRTTDASYDRDPQRPWTNRLLKIVLWGILLIAASPFILGTAGVSLGAVTGVLCLIFGGIAVVFCLTAAAFIIGVFLVVLGVVLLFTAPLDSLFLFGIAAAGIGCGLIGVVLLILICKLFPLCFRGVKKLFNMIMRKGEGGKAV